MSVCCLRQGVHGFGGERTVVVVARPWRENSSLEMEHDWSQVVRVGGLSRAGILDNRRLALPQLVRDVGKPLFCCNKDRVRKRYL